jgi:hypothetical protein
MLKKFFSVSIVIAVAVFVVFGAPMFGPESTKVWTAFGVAAIPAAVASLFLLAYMGPYSRDYEPALMLYIFALPFCSWLVADSYGMIDHFNPGLFGGFILTVLFGFSQP